MSQKRHNMAQQNATAPILAQQKCFWDVSRSAVRVGFRFSLWCCWSSICLLQPRLRGAGQDTSSENTTQWLTDGWREMAKERKPRGTTGETFGWREIETLCDVWDGSYRDGQCGVGLK